MFKRKPKETGDVSRRSLVRRLQSFNLLRRKFGSSCQERRLAGLFFVYIFVFLSLLFFYMFFCFFIGLVLYIRFSLVGLMWFGLLVCLWYVLCTESTEAW